MRCPRCQSDATVKRFCCSCGKPFPSVHPLARKSLEEAREKQRTCNHAQTTKLADDWTNGDGFSVERCNDCGYVIRMALA